MERGRLGGGREGGAVPWRDYGSGVKATATATGRRRGEKEKYEAGGKASAGRRSKSQLCSAAGTVRREKRRKGIFGGRAGHIRFHSSSYVYPACHLFAFMVVGRAPLNLLRYSSTGFLYLSQKINSIPGRGLLFLFPGLQLSRAKRRRRVFSTVISPAISPASFLFGGRRGGGEGNGPGIAVRMYIE